MDQIIQNVGIFLARERLIKENDYDQAEMYLMRAQQFTEPALDKTIWIHQLEWFYQRLNIALNLQSIYQKQKRYSSCYDILYQITEQCEKSHLFEKIWQNIESNIDFAYYQLQITAMLQQKYVEAFASCKKCISIIDFYEREYNKQQTMIDKNQQELLLQTYGEERGYVYLQHKALLQKKLTLRMYCFYQGARALYKTGNKTNAIKFFKMAWKKAQELFQDQDKVQMFYKRYEKVKNELEFDKNLNNESIEDFSKFTVEVKKASIRNQQKLIQGQDLDQQSQQNLGYENTAKQNELKITLSANSLVNELDEINSQQFLNQPNNGNANNISDFLNSQNSDNPDKSQSKKSQRKLDFINIATSIRKIQLLTKQDSENLTEDEQQQQKLDMMLKRSESTKVRKNTFFNTNQNITNSPKKIFSTNTTPKNGGRTINLQTFGSNRQESPSKMSLRKKKQAVSVHLSNQNQGRSGSQSGKQGGNQGISPSGTEPTVFSFTTQAQTKSNFSAKMKKQLQLTRPQTGDAQKIRRKASSLEGFTINSNSSLSYQSIESGVDDNNDLRKQNHKLQEQNDNQLQGQKKIVSINAKNSPSKSPQKDNLNNSFEDLLIQFHYPNKSIKSNLRQTSKIQKTRPITANPSRNSTLSDIERKQGKTKISQILGSNQITSYASSIVGGQSGSTQTTPLRTNHIDFGAVSNQQLQTDNQDDKTQKIRSQLNYFLKGRKPTQNSEAVKKLRKYYQDLYGKSTDTKDHDKTLQDKTQQDQQDSATKKVVLSQYGQKHTRSQSSHQNVQGTDIVNALDMNQFLQNQFQQNQQKTQAQGTNSQTQKPASGAYINQQQAKSFISNIFTNSQHPTTSTTMKQQSRPSSSLSKAKSKGSFHVPASVHSIQSSTRNKILSQHQLMDKRHKGSKSQHISSNQFYFPLKDDQHQDSQTNVVQKNQTAIHLNTFQNDEIVTEENHQLNENKQVSFLGDSEKYHDETQKSESKQVNFAIKDDIDNISNKQADSYQDNKENKVSLTTFQNFPVSSITSIPEYKRLSMHRKLKPGQTSQTSFQQSLNQFDNDILDLNHPNAPAISQKYIETGAENAFAKGNVFFLNPTTAVNQSKQSNKLLRKATINVAQQQKRQPSETNLDLIQTRSSKSKTIDHSHKLLGDKGSTLSYFKPAFIKTESHNKNEYDKKSKIYKQIDDIFQKDPAIQSKLNSQLLKLSSPKNLLPSPQKEPKGDYFNFSEQQYINGPQSQTSQLDEQNLLKHSSNVDGSKELDRQKTSQSQYQHEGEQKKMIKNDSNLIDFVMQSKLGMVVLSRPAPILKNSKQRNISPEISEQNIRQDQFAMDKGQKYSQMIFGGVDSEQAHTAGREKMRDKKESVVSNQNMNSFQTHNQHSMTNQDTKSFIRSRQQSEQIQISNHYKGNISGLNKLRRQETVSLSNSNQQKLSSNNSSKKNNLNSTSLQAQQSNNHTQNAGNQGQYQRRQSISKQNSISGINSKKMNNLSGLYQQQGNAKQNVKTVVSLAAMPEDELDKEDEQETHQREVTSEDEEESEVSNSKNLLSKSGNINIDLVVQNEASVLGTEPKKLKINLTPLHLSVKLEENAKKRNLTLLSLTDESQDNSQTSIRARKHSELNIKQKKKKQRKNSNQLHYRNQRSKQQINFKQELKEKVKNYREELKQMMKVKKINAIILIQQFWRQYKNGFQNYVQNEQGQQNAGNIDSYSNQNAGTTSIIENNKNNTNSSLSNQNSSALAMKLKYSKNTFTNLQININQTESQNFVRSKKQSDGSFKSNISVTKKPTMQFNHKSPSPYKYQKNQHFFPQNVNEGGNQLSQGSYQNIPIPGYQQNTLMPHQQHVFHKSASISSHKIMSFFKEPKKKKQAIEARRILNDIQVKPVIPLKFYLYQFQKGLSFWKISNFFASFKVQSDDVLVTMMFEINVLNFKGMLPIKFKIGIQDMVNISQFKKATKWSLATQLLNFYFKSKSLYKKWEEHQQNLRSSANPSFFLLLDGMEDERNKILEEEELQIKIYEKNNEETYKFRSDSQSYIEMNDIYIQEIIQLFERLSFFIPNYTLFIQKISGQVIEVIESINNSSIVGYGQSNTSIQEKTNLKQNTYEKNLKEMRIFKQNRKDKIRELSFKVQFLTSYTIDKQFHMITHTNLPDETITSNHKLSTNKKITTSCSIDDVVNEQRTVSIQANQTNNQTSNLNTSNLKRNIFLQQKDNSQNFLRFTKNEIDSPITPATIFGREQDVVLMTTDVLELQSQNPFSQTSIAYAHYQKINNSAQSLDLQIDLQLEDNSIKNSKESTLNVQSNKHTPSSKAINQNFVLPILQKRQSQKTSSTQLQLAQQSQQQQSPSLNGQKSPQAFSSGILPLQIQNSSLGNKMNVRRSSLFFQKMMEQRMKEVNQSNNLQNTGSSPIPLLSDKQESFPTPKRSIGDDFQDYVDDNSIIPNFLHTTPKNNQQPISPLNPQFLKQSFASFHQQQFPQQYASLSQSFRIQHQNQLSFFEEDQNNFYDSVDLFKKGSDQLNQELIDSDQQLLIKHYEYKLDSSSNTPHHINQNEESMDTPLFSNSANNPYQNFKRGFKKATTILEENQEEALQQSQYQTINNIQSGTVNKIESNQIEDINEDESSEITQDRNPVVLIRGTPSPKNGLGFIFLRQLEKNRQKQLIKEINYWRQIRYFETHDNNKHFFIPESYINPFQQKQISFDFQYNFNTNYQLQTLLNIDITSNQSISYLKEEFEIMFIIILKQSQILMKTIVKKNKELYLAVLRIQIENEQEEQINTVKKEGVDIILQLYQVNLKGNWSDQMSLNLFIFIDEFFPSNDLDIIQPSIEDNEVGENQEFKLNYRYQRAFKFPKVKQKLSLNQILFSYQG